MKKTTIFSLFAAASLLTLASCSGENDIPATGDGVSITVNLPADLSRGTFGDGTGEGDRATLDNLQWSVFEVLDNGQLRFVYSDQKAAFSASQTRETVELPLAKGKTYQVAFYADDKDNKFASYTDGVINVDYANAASNQAAEDAFVGYSQVFTVKGPYNETVTLNRPFAQLNWGTDDLGAKAIEPLINDLTAEVQVTSGLYESMNVITGEMGNPIPAETATSFGTVNLNNLPTQTFPVEKPADAADNTPYALIAMDYLLTGNGNINCQLAFNQGIDPVKVDNAPVKPNYRTNIYGSLLVEPNTFQIVIDNNFAGDNNHEIVSSQTDLETAMKAGKEDITLVPGEYILRNDMMPKGKNFRIHGTDKENTKLTVPASLYSENGGVTLENLTYTLPTGLDYTESKFGFIQRVKNVEIKDCIIDGSLRLNIVDGGVANIEGCTFNVNTKSGFDGYGLFYYAATGSTVNVKNCKFNTQSKAIVLYNESPQVYNLNVDKCKFVASQTSDKCAIQMHTEWGISGIVRINNCTATGFLDKNGGLWNEVNNSTQEETYKFDIFVDGVQEHTAR